MASADSTPKRSSRSRCIKEEANRHVWLPSCFSSVPNAIAVARFVAIRQECLLLPKYHSATLCKSPVFAGSEGADWATKSTYGCSGKVAWRAVGNADFNGDAEFNGDA